MYTDECQFEKGMLERHTNPLITVSYKTAHNSKTKHMSLVTKLQNCKIAKLCHFGKYNNSK